MLYRKSYEDIKQWYYNSEKALLVDGARQVGKTTLIRNFFNDNNIPFVEINLHDESFGMRFKGTISCIPNYQFSRKLSGRINLDTGDLIDAGGTWVFSSDPKKKTILGGSNITGHTYGTINIDEDNYDLHYYKHKVPLINIVPL